MRALVNTLGWLLFVLGLLFTGAMVFQMSSGSGYVSGGGNDWTCIAKESVQTCTYGLNDPAELQGKALGSLAAVIGGAAAAICGAVFIAVSSLPVWQRQATPRPPMMQPALGPYPQQPQYGGPQTGPQGMPQPPAPPNGPSQQG